MRSALVEVPPERLAGVVLLSDGQVHDVPAGLPPELGGAPLHALIAGKKEYENGPETLAVHTKLTLLASGKLPKMPG